LVSTFRSLFCAPVSIAYTIVFLLFSGRALALGDARVEMEREIAVIDFFRLKIGAKA
jgi:cell division protein FtsL